MQDREELARLGLLEASELVQDTYADPEPYSQSIV